MGKRLLQQSSGGGGSGKDVGGRSLRSLDVTEASWALRLHKVVTPATAAAVCKPGQNTLSLCMGARELVSRAGSFGQFRL